MPDGVLWVEQQRLCPARLAVGEAVILLHDPPSLVGVSIVMERERQQNESLVNGYRQAVRRPAGCLPDPVQGAVGQQCALQWP